MTWRNASASLVTCLALGVVLACGRFDETGSDPGGVADARDGGVTATDSGAAEPDAAVPPPCAGAVSCERVVFTTSVQYTGDLGGLDGADAHCNELAAGSGVHPRVKGRKFKAWLSLSATFVETRFVHGQGAYVRSDGQVVADDWSKFASASHRVPMNVDESGLTLPGGIDVWTGSEATGTSLTATCGGWSYASNILGAVGAMNATSAQWSDATTLGCTEKARLYCIEE